MVRVDRQVGGRDEIQGAMVGVVRHWLEMDGIGIEHLCGWV